MFQKIKNWLKNLTKSKSEKAELKKMKAYYEKMQLGAYVLQFMHKDMAEQKKKMNRAQRRRWEADFIHKGEFNAEMVMHYINHFDRMVEYIDKKIEESKTKKTTLVKK